MCGICGQFNLDKTAVSSEILRRMTDSLRHRGPDGEGFYLSRDKVVGFGHRRLAIIDLTTGSQPMTNENQSLWLVFNGEIYNFLELKSRLQKKGHRFKTKSDTEVILHSFEEYGEKCVKDFNGMFAFAIWDERRKKMFLARDRLGKKPLFYFLNEKVFIFASEVKALLLNPEVKKEIDNEALSVYLSLGYFLSPFSIIKGVKKLPPASTLTIYSSSSSLQLSSEIMNSKTFVYDANSSYLNIENGRSHIHEYWDINRPGKTNYSEEEWISKFNILMKDSVEKRLLADVPLGLFLSGGIDSTSILSFMGEAGCKNPQTISIGFKEKSYNELYYSRQAASFWSTSHQEAIVDSDIDEELSRIIWANDEPFGDTSAIPTYFLSRLARKKVKVALSGEGGDETFGGYETYIADKLFNLYKCLPLKDLIAYLVINFLPTGFGKVSFDYKLKQFVRAGNFSSEKAHYSWREIFSRQEKDKLLNSAIKKEIKTIETFDYFKKYFDKYQRGDNTCFLDQALYVDTKTWLPDDVLTKVDRAGMGNSLEIRAPFLDYRLVELLAKMPADLKVKGWQTKFLLKKAMAGRIPEKIIRRPKSGFNAPIPVWLRTNLKSLLVDSLSKTNIQKDGIFNYSYVQELFQDYFSGRKDNSLKLWLLFNFVKWKEIFLN